MNLRWTRRALHDLERIGASIARDKPLAAKAFAVEVRGKVKNLERFPFMGRAGALPDTRELIVHRNYLVTYRVRADEIQIVQIWHVARHR